MVCVISVKGVSLSETEKIVETISKYLNVELVTVKQNGELVCKYKPF